MSHIAKSSLLIAIFFGIDKILGFIRQVFVARQFGLSYEIDVFNAANNIPDMLSALISGGALGVALIPVLSEFLTRRGRPAAWDVFSRILNLAFLVTGAISLLIALFADPLVRLIIVPGFPAEQQTLTIELMRLDLVAIMIFSISGLLMAGLQTNQHFLLPALAPGLYNVGQIFGITVLSPSTPITIAGFTLPAFGLGIHGLVYGVILGALLHLLIQVPGMLRYEFRWQPKIDLRNPGVQQVLKVLAPRVMTMFFLQIFFIARDNIASHLGEGAVTALNYGWFIMQVPETMIGSALAIALLPTLSEQIARGDVKGYAETINRALKVILALTIPSAALLAAGMRPLVQELFHFDAAGTEMVVWATRAYLLGLMGHSMLETAARSFYARQNAIIPLIAAAINAVVYIILAVSLSRVLGVPGIALGNSLAFTSEALLLFYLLNRRTPGIFAVGDTLLRVVPASLAAMFVITAILRLPAPNLPFGELLLAFGALLVGGLIVLPLMWKDLRVLLKL